MEKHLHAGWQDASGIQQSLTERTKKHTQTQSDI